MNTEVDIRERVARVETKIDHIIDNMTNLPPSPDTVKRLEKLEEDNEAHTAFEQKLNERIAWVVGAFTVVAGGIGWFGKLIWEKITLAILTQAASSLRTKLI